ncbi:MAG TPA: hypothetical protein VLA76_10845 [Candidatus Angelobacter sp.]|nr:hypothetical protein [Candidatus Angelobacter sp.]
MTAPDLVTLGSGDLVVELLPALGGRLHRIRAFGHDLLRTPPHPRIHASEGFFWGAYPMAPWCNRARAGSHRVAGRRVDLAANFPDGSAIHGLVSDVPWQIAGLGRLSVEVDDPAWPWPFGVALNATVGSAAVTLGYRLTNRADAPMPAGLGLHPWFVAPLEVAIPARAAYRANTDSPADPEPVAGGLDLSTRARPTRDLDATWTGLRRPEVVIAWPGLGIEATLTAATAAGALNVALASPADLGAVAVEPQTHGPDPLRRLAHGEPDAPVLLAPGADLALDLRLEVRLARNVR